MAINKIDLVGYREDIFRQIADDFAVFGAQLGFRSITAIPISARFGDNVTAPSANMPWYRGPTLLDYLETVDIGSESAQRPFRFPVQWVNRPNLDFRGYAGTVASGSIAVGDADRRCRLRPKIPHQGIADL